MENVVMEAVVNHPRAISEDAKSVRDVLIERGLETPVFDNGLSRDQKYQRIRDSFADIISTLGL